MEETRETAAMVRAAEENFMSMVLVKASWLRLIKADSSEVSEYGGRIGRLYKKYGSQG